jgi:hypothetical protein
VPKPEVHVCLGGENMGIAMSVPCLITAVQATIQERPESPNSSRSLSRKFIKAT